MKKHALYFSLLFLFACDSSDHVEFAEREPSPPAQYVPFEDGTFTYQINKETGVLEIIWTPESNWQSYTLCETNESSGNNCAVISAGNTDSGSLNLILGENISLEQLINNDLFILVSDKNGNAVGSQSFDITQELINASIQYIKASNTGAIDKFASISTLSRNGKTLVISAPSEDSFTVNPEDGKSSDSGAVYIFENTSTGWQETDFIKLYPEGEHAHAHTYFGTGLSINAAGNRLAIIARNPNSSKVYLSVLEKGQSLEASEQNWQSLLINVEGLVLTREEFYNARVKISPDGSTIAMVGLNGTKILVFVKDAETNEWTEVNAIMPEVSDYLFGNQLALSNDGSVIAIGAKKTGFDEAFALIFRKQETGEYGQDELFVSLNITSSSSHLFLDLSLDGNIFAFKGGSDQLAIIFKYISGEWQRWDYETDYNFGENPNFFSENVKLSDNGKILAVLSSAAFIAPGINGEIIDGVSNYGEIIIFKLTQNEALTQYRLQPSFIDGDYQITHGVELSGDGKTLVIGSELEDSSAMGINNEIPGDIGATDSGAVWIYRF